METASIDRLYGRIDEFLADGRRRILGLTGAPGSGKSTLGAQLALRAPEHCVIVPMDGYHLANCELARLGNADRKGAQDTYDSGGYVALLERLRQQRPGEIVYAPEFRRGMNESIAGAIPVFSEQRIVITEGNYLLLESGEWGKIRSLADEIWYIDIDQELRLQRLIARHIEFGRDEAAAREWVLRSDERNAELIASTRARADLIVRLPASWQSPV